MEKVQYFMEIHRQLNDTSVYDKLSRDPTSEIRSKIEAVITKYSTLGIIDTKTCEFLRKNNPITPVFCTLPKIHKDLSNPPGRPIVASTDSILSPLSIYLEKILTPITQTSHSFILDTGEFLQCIRELHRVPTNTLLVTLDVKDLYTSIPHLNGINVVHHSLTTAGLTTNQIDLCVELLTIVLYNNFFLFLDTFYLQKRGTAMGSNVAPPANIFRSALQFCTHYHHCPRWGSQSKFPISMSLECGRKPECPEETHANTERTYKLFADVVLGGIRTQDSSAARLQC
ncbi:unnamed protein product [Ranitomeya imitator]|uniref:Reverse transcriptase domain-containing protein n=1 Tax=Ranitomeya imitator TaxID=111125 RepID=A0ABN9L648_9NEOB|nr:unnamed protein product [Ranitomeya imitator]